MANTVPNLFFQYVTFPIILFEFNMLEVDFLLKIILALWQYLEMMVIKQVNI